MPAKRHIVAAFLLTTSVAAADNHYRPQVDSDGFPLVGNVAAKGGSERPKRPSPPPDDQVKQELKDLRNQLLSAKKEDVTKSMARFRPLCDAEGYPLVGNLATKASGMQPSEYCTIVRGEK
jgi:hypothetical protein